MKTLRWTEFIKETGGNQSTVSGTIFACQACILLLSRSGERPASAAGKVSIWIMASDFLTCGAQPKSHQSLRMRAAGCGLRRQREAAGEGMRLSETPAVERFHTSHSPAEDRGEKEAPGVSEFSSLNPFTPLMFHCSWFLQACLFFCR